MIDERAENELIGGGDTRLHHHLEDRTTQSQLQENEKIAWPTAAFDATDEDYIFADTTSGAFSIVLPVAKKGAIITVVRIAGANTLTVSRSGSDTINGATSLSITSSYVPRRLKAVNGIGYIEV